MSLTGSRSKHKQADIKQTIRNRKTGTDGLNASVQHGKRAGELVIYTEGLMRL